METQKRKRAGSLLIPMFIIFMLSCLTLLPSCFAVFRVPGPERHGEQHDNGRRGHDDHHR